MQSLYIAPLDSLPKHLTIIMSFIEILKKRTNNIAFFSPIVSSKKNDKAISLVIEHYALDMEYSDAIGFEIKEVKTAIANEEFKELIQTLISRFRALKKKYDFVLCNGIYLSPLSLPIDFDINLEIAKNLNTAIADILNSDGRDALELIEDIKIRSNVVKKAGCTHFGTFTTQINECELPQLKKDATQYSNLYFLSQTTDFSNCTKDIEQRLNSMPAPSVTTPIMFEYDLFEKARKDKKRVVLPESSDDRILIAAATIIKQEVADIILLGDQININKKSESLGLDLSKATIIDPAKFSLKDKYSQDFYELRKSKGVTIELAKETMRDLNYFGTMMVYNGDADGMVSGAIHTTSDTIRPALQIIKTKPDISIISSVLFMCLDTKTLVYGDCAINKNPTAEELAQIAISSADTSKGFGIKPKIAMLSYSSGNSGEGADVNRVKEAVKIVKNKRPDLSIEGPIQYDAAVDLTVAKTKLPQSEVAGYANIFIFPDLNAGNIAYKAVQRSANVLAVGPVLQGLKKPINDLSRGCLVADIVNTVAITAIQAQSIKESNL